MEALKKNIISQIELAVLHSLYQKQSKTDPQATAEISEISVETGIRDNDEVLRALYTLEGKSFVIPEPPGSFTSSVWRITASGMKAVRLVKTVS